MPQAKMLKKLASEQEWVVEKKIKEVYKDVFKEQGHEEEVGNVMQKLRHGYAGRETELYHMVCWKNGLTLATPVPLLPFFSPELFRASRHFVLAGREFISPRSEFFSHGQEYTKAADDHSIKHG